MRVGFTGTRKGMTLSQSEAIRNLLAAKNFRTKKALKEAVAKGEKVTVYQPGPFGDKVPTDGTVFLEGPHYPEPHSWYAEATLKNGIVVKVK